MRIKGLILALFVWQATVFGATDTIIWQEAESFKNTGGWSNDTQHVDIMGSPYLLATGQGDPVKDAVTEVEVSQAGKYTLWVRCRDWYPAHSPGQFKVTVGGQESDVIFGKAASDDWSWVRGGAFDLKSGVVELRLKDSSGWWGRCDAVVLSQGAFKPSDNFTVLQEQREKYFGVSAEVKAMGNYDVVVVGGGSSGLGAALAAARNGAKTAFIHDRPVLGGNASDEISVPPMGYLGKPPDKINVTGIAEELYPLQGWTHFGSSEHYEKLVRAEKNISLFLNTRAVDVEMKDKSTISAVIALNVHSGQRMRFKAPLFIDTTGHGWIGFYAGADYQVGTDSKKEYGESMAPEMANKHTMGNSLYVASYKDMGKATPFDTPAWAYQWKSWGDFQGPVKRSSKVVRPDLYDKASRGPGRPPKNKGFGGLALGGAYSWFVETGGMSDTVKDAEKIRDDLFRIHIGL